MANATTPKPLMDRLARVGKRTAKEELEDLAEYAGEVAEWTNELECKFADFAANVEMLYEPDTTRDERADLRRRIIQDAEAAAGALRAISEWCT